MRYTCPALFVLMLSASASAQGVSTQFAPEPLQVLSTVRTFQAHIAEPRLSADDVLARMMTFDRDRDGKVATGELSERMQDLVARGDKSGDGALDESEIRMLATAKQFAVRFQSGGYGFGDTTLSSRNHIENSIDDLRLAPNARQKAMRIAFAFVDELEAASADNLRQALAPVITEQQLAQLEASLRRTGVPTVMIGTGTPATGSSVPAVPTLVAVTTLLVTQQMSSEQMHMVAPAVEAFRSERQFDEARQSELVARLRDVLTIEESGNLRASLARRPLVKGAGSSLAHVLPASRTLQFTAQPAVR